MRFKAKYDLCVIGTVGLPAGYGGFETLAENLVRNLSQENKIVVACSRHKVKPHQSYHDGAVLRYFNWKANGWQSVPYDIFSMLKLAQETRKMLVLGVSGCIALPFIRLAFPRTFIVTNIDGLEWKREKWGWFQKRFLRLSEWFAVKFSHAVVADNEGIKRYIDHKYGIESAFIPYGGVDSALLNHLARIGNVEKKDYHLALCRIEPENNIEMILDAFSMSPSHRLVFVGNWGASSYSRALHCKYSKNENIELRMPIYEKNELLKLRKGSISYIHGHSAGGTNPSLVEAMGASMACLCFDVCYNRYTTYNNAIYWTSAEDLMKYLDSLTESDYKELSLLMKGICSEYYTWELVSEQYKNILGL